MGSALDGELNQNSCRNGEAMSEVQFRILTQRVHTARHKNSLYFFSFYRPQCAKKFFCQSQNNQMQITFTTSNHVQSHSATKKGLIKEQINSLKFTQSE